MERDKIIEMARQSGLQLSIYAEAYPNIFQQLERFANLSFNDGYEKGVKGFHDAVKFEREECAKICEVLGNDIHGLGRDDSEAFDCADAIRARGNK